MVEERINVLRELYNNPECYELLKIVVRQNMTLLARGVRMAATRVRDVDDHAAVHLLAQELDPQ